MRRIASPLIVATIAAATWLSCGHEPSVCPENLSIDISNGVLDLYNGVLISSPGSGSGAFMCNGGSGGTYSGSWNSGGYDLTVSFTGCYVKGSISTLTLTGTIHDTTNLSTHVEDGHADALMIQGHETSCYADPIDATCVVDFHFDGRDSSGVPQGSGSVCGITFP